MTTAITFTLSELNTFTTPGVAYIHKDYTIIGDAYAEMDVSAACFNNLFVFTSPTVVVSTLDLTAMLFGLNYVGDASGCIFPNFIGNTLVQVGSSLGETVGLDYLRYVIFALYSTVTLNYVTNVSEYTTTFNENTQTSFNTAMTVLATNGWGAVPTGTTTNVTYNVFDQISTFDPTRLLALTNLVVADIVNPHLIPISSYTYALPIYAGDIIRFKVTVVANSAQFTGGTSVNPRSYVIKMKVV